MAKEIPIRCYRGRGSELKPVTLQGETLIDFKDWLLRHETDIVHDINDFGDLWYVFAYVIGRLPEKT